MADFPIQFRASDYRTEHGQLIHAKRGYLLCEFTRFPVLCDGFLDTAAPFSVVPYTFSRHLAWNRVAQNLTKAALSQTAALTWEGIACELGTIDFRFVHLASGMRSSALLMLARFPKRPAPPALERALVLGLALFDDNDIQVLIEHGAGMVIGRVSAP